MLRTFGGPRPWQNWHQTISGTLAAVDKIFYPPDRPVYGSPAINRCTRQIQRSIGRAKAQGLEHRTVGRGWSLSDAPLTSGIMLDIADLTGKKRLRTDQLDPAYPGNAQAANGLCLVQGGNYISELNPWLENDINQLSLRTTGAANGQTIAGATATGTHGSALDHGSLHDHIVAIHLITGEHEQFWLERASYPVMKEALPQSINAQLLRDDDVFNAVLMGLGAFGVIHNVVIEARERFLLKAYNYDKGHDGQKLVLDGAMRNRIANLDFASDPNLNPPNESGKPYFFQPIINPNTDPPEVLVTQMYERQWDPAYRPDYAIKQGTFGPGYDFVSVAGQALDMFSGVVPLFAQLVAGTLFEVGDKTGSWGEQFGYKAFRTKVASGTVAVPLARALDTIDLLLELNDDMGPVPLVLGCRYVRKSPALLAFNRWDPTFVISIDGVYNNSSLAFFDAIPGEMEAAGIPFTQHWGKTHGYTPQRIANVYGGDRDKWVAARTQLLPDPAQRAMFGNKFLRDLGLA
ncbi:FAD-binding protein [Aurantiacibacter poecillastricola]|uniref:FAD-binding protein n=1 Tax=Aurantiacibacter poecillastricola TaxID=3064385 RepID=UPI0035A2BEBD